MALTALLLNIRELLRPQLFRAGAIELSEEDPGSSIAPFKLETSQPALVLRFDQVPHEGMSLNDRLFPLLDHTKPGLCVHCDYVILRQAHGRESEPLYVLLIELKSGPTGGALKQIESSRLLIDGALAMMRHASKTAPWTSVVRYRGLIFTPQARPVAGDPRRVPCPYEASQAMGDVHFVHLPPCPGYQLDWFCSDGARRSRR